MEAVTVLLARRHVEVAAAVVTVPVPVLVVEVVPVPASVTDEVRGDSSPVDSDSALPSIELSAGVALTLVASRVALDTGRLSSPSSLRTVVVVLRAALELSSTRCCARDCT